MYFLLYGQISDPDFYNCICSAGWTGTDCGAGGGIIIIVYCFCIFRASGRRSDNRPLAGCEICDTNWYGAGRNRILVRLHGKICDACICHDLFRVCRAEPVSSQCDAGADRG